MRADLQRVENADGFLEWASAEPGPAVCGRVRAYTGYREDTPSPVRRLETPTGALTVILRHAAPRSFVVTVAHAAAMTNDGATQRGPASAARGTRHAARGTSFGDRFRARAATGAGQLSAYTSFVAGMHDRPSRTEHDGRQFGVQIRLDPPGAFSLLGVPLHEVGNRVVELSELVGADAERWAGQLADTRGWRDRFVLLDRLLADRMARGPVPSPALEWAWRGMQRAGGAVRVAALVDGAGCSHRHLVAQFRQQV